MGRRKNRVKFEAHVSASDAKRIRQLANSAGVSASHLVTRLVEVAAARGRAGRVNLADELHECAGFLTLSSTWQQLIDDREAPGSTYLEIDLRCSSSRFCRPKGKIGAG